MTQYEPEQPLTFGQKAVGLTFNPSNNEDVQELKQLYAQIIDKHQRIIENILQDNDPNAGERLRLHKIAITEAQGAQMWAVKAVTWDL
jgi:hypothetical protein